MSTCPEMELHSAYIDGEIESPWYDEIKSHIESCDECKVHVKKLESISSAMKRDSETLNFTEEELDESFVRLQSRLRYTKVASKSRVVYADFARKVIPYAAAAVFLAAIILPSANIRSQVQQRFNTVAVVTPSSSAELINKTGLAADENLNVSAIKVVDSSSAGRKVSANPVALHVSNLTKVDVFKPEFSAESAQLNIKLSEPIVDISDLPVIMPDTQQAVYYSNDFYR